MSRPGILSLCVLACLACAGEGGGQRAARLASSATSATSNDDAELVTGRTSDSATLPMAQTPVGGPDDAIERSAPSAERAEAQPSAIERRELPKDAAGAVVKRLPSWAGRWSKILKGFSPRRFVLAEVLEIPDTGSEETTQGKGSILYDLEFARRHKSLFRPSPDDFLWADIYVASFELGGPEKSLRASVGDASFLNLMNPRTGHAQLVWVLGISCGFDDAFWLDRRRLVAVGSCVEEEKQRPFVARVDLDSHVLERFDYPVAGPTRFDTERYIRQKNPQIRF